MKKKIVAGALALAVAFSAGTATQSKAFNLGDVLGGVVKVGGVGFIVDKYGDSINSFLNKIFAQNNLSTVYTTKVVPIVSMGDGKYIGAVQVTGPQEEVQKVQAVLQLETSFNAFRMKGLIPIDRQNPLKANRVQGVGVSAIIDVHF